MEIKNKLTVTREPGRGYNRKKRGRGKSRNMNRGLMGMDNGVGINCGSRWGSWAAESSGEKVGTTVTEQQY